MSHLTHASAIVALLACVAYLTPADSRASEWNRFRGPNGSGVAETSSLPIRFGPDRNAIWSFEAGDGHSSPVLTDDLVLITAAEGETLFTLALRRSDGGVAWKRSIHADRTEAFDKRNNRASPTPAIDASGVYVFFPDFGLVAYDIEGNERWRLPLGPFDNIYGMGASPIVVDDKVVLVCDQSSGSFAVGVNKVTGAISWKVDRPEAKSGHSTPVVYEPEQGQPQVLIPGSFLLTAYAPGDGERLWWVGGLSYEMKSTPVIVDDMIFVNGYGAPFNQPDKIVEVPEFRSALEEHDADGDGGISESEFPKNVVGWIFEFVDLDADGTMSESEWDFYRAVRASKNGMMGIRLGGSGDVSAQNRVWEYHRAVPQLPSPIIYGGALFMINDRGIVTTFEPRSGKVIAQGRLEGAAGNYFASPVAGDGKIYTVSEGGMVAVIVAGGGLDVLAVNDMGASCYATPAIEAGRIYLRTVKTLYCFGIAE